MSEKIPHMVEQVIKYSDGTETVISYRGVIEDGVLTEDKPKKKKTIGSKIKEIIGA